MRDFSGKKPHDYQKQMKKLSSSTYSSEYKFIATFDRRNSFYSMRATNHGQFTENRHTLSPLPERKHSDDSVIKLRRTKTLMGGSLGGSLSKGLGRTESCASSSSGGSQGGTSLENLFRLNPEQRYDKKYRRMMKKKFKNTFESSA